MDFTPNVMIHWSDSFRKLEEEEWRSIREWLKYKFFTCYDYIDYLAKEITTADELMKTLDGINHRYGRGTAFIAGEGVKKRWSMRQEHCSPHYTTNWNQLPIVSM